MKAKIFVGVLVGKEILVDDVSFLYHKNGAMSEHRCHGHTEEDGSVGVLGNESPKASILSGKERYLLCASCWKSQGFKED